MGDVLQFKSRHQRDVEMVLPQLDDKELIGLKRLLAGGCIMQYYRFSEHKISINAESIPLVLEEMKRRGVVDPNDILIRGWGGLTLSDSYQGRLPDPATSPPVTSISFSASDGSSGWTRWPLKPDSDALRPKYDPINLFDLRDAHVEFYEPSKKEREIAEQHLCKDLIPRPVTRYEDGPD